MVVREVWVVMTDGVRDVEVETADALLGEGSGREDDGDGGGEDDDVDEMGDEVEEVRTAELDDDLQAVRTRHVEEYGVSRDSHEARTVGGI